MTVDLENLLTSILDSISRIEHVNPDDIPNIDLYMDQVTTFMDTRLKSSSRFPGEDKIMTKTMINNYAKNNLIPSPNKKRYSKEHILLLIFVYYYKSILSITDIQTMLKPLTDRYFQSGKEFDLEKVYSEVFSMEKDQIEDMKKDVIRKFKKSRQTFEDAPEKEQEFLKTFSFICLLSFDVYVKKLLIEKMIDEIAVKQPSRKNDKANAKAKSNKERMAKEAAAKARKNDSKQDKTRR